MNPKLQQDISSVPAGMGIYIFKNAAGKALYVGKSVSLPDRIQSHIQHPATRGGKKLLEQAETLDTIICATEAEALYLEQQMILQLNPRYNVRLREGSDRWYIAVSEQEEYPRIWLTHRIDPDYRYFGPYGARHGRQIIEAIGRSLLIRTCTGVQPGRKSGSPCLDYHIGRCSAPCINAISESDYRQQILIAMQALSGHPEKLLATIDAQMQAASTEMRFEAAARLRDDAQTLRSLFHAQPAPFDGLPSECDIVAVHSDDDIQLLFWAAIRNGALFSQRFYELTAYGDIGETLQAWQENPAVNAQLSSTVLTPQMAGGVHSPSIDKAGLWAISNAKQHVRRLKIRKINTAPAWDTSAALERLGECLSIAPPGRIECYDISNLRDKAIVAMMMVMHGGELDYAAMRRFRINGLQQDDFASLEQTMRRRLKHLGEAGWEKPDLIVIDGGIGQVGAVAPLLTGLRQAGCALIGLQKPEETIILPDGDLIQLDKHDTARLLLTQLRDATHQAVISYHRQKRDTDWASPQIPGIGAQSLQKLLRHFHDFEGIRQSDEAELRLLVGPHRANIIRQYFIDTEG